MWKIILIIIAAFPIALLLENMRVEIHNNRVKSGKAKDITDKEKFDNWLYSEDKQKNKQDIEIEMDDVEETYLKGKVSKYTTKNSDKEKQEYNDKTLNF